MKIPLLWILGDKLHYYRQDQAKSHCPLTNHLCRHLCNCSGSWDKGSGKIKENLGDIQCKAFIEVVATDILVRDIVVTCFRIIAGLFLSWIFIMPAAAGLEQFNEKRKSSQRHQLGHFDLRSKATHRYRRCSAVHNAVLQTFLCKLLCLQMSLQ